MRERDEAAMQGRALKKEIATLKQKIDSSQREVAESKKKNVGGANYSLSGFLKRVDDPLKIEEVEKELCKLSLELDQKISENEELHMSIFDMKRDFNKVLMVEKREVEGQLEQRNEQLEAVREELSRKDAILREKEVSLLE